MAEVKFVDGLFVSKREGSPDFVKANLAFTEKFIAYLQENFNAKGYVNVDVLESKEGKLYAKLNDWKPEGQVNIYGNEAKNLNEDKEIDFSKISF